MAGSLYCKVPYFRDEAGSSTAVVRIRNQNEECEQKFTKSAKKSYSLPPPASVRLFTGTPADMPAEQQNSFAIFASFCSNSSPSLTAGGWGPAFAFGLRHGKHPPFRSFGRPCLFWRGELASPCAWLGASQGLRRLGTSALQGENASWPLLEGGRPRPP